MNDRIKPGVDLLAEFTALRDEVLHRLRVTVMLMTFNVTAAGVLLGQGLSHEPDIFLVVPLVTSLFGLFIVMQNCRMYELGDYIRTKLEPKVNAAATLPILGWESWFKRGKEHFWSQFWIGQFPVLGATVFPSLVAFALWFDRATTKSWPIWILACIDALLVLLMVEEHLRRMFSFPRRRESQGAQPENPGD